MQKKLLFLMLSIVGVLGAQHVLQAAPAKAAFSEQEYQVRQGRTIRAQIKVTKIPASVQIRFLSKTYSCYQVPDNPHIYESYIPVLCETQPGLHWLQARIKDKHGQRTVLKRPVKIFKVNFPKQKGLRLSFKQLADKVKSESKNCCKTSQIVFSDDKTEDIFVSQDMVALAKRSPKRRLWKGPFNLPTIVQRYTTKFGEMRNSPRCGKYYHKAVDIAAPPKYIVRSAHNGKIIDRNRYKGSGNTVVVDHGLGVFTHYFHLDGFTNIKVGDYVKKGQPIGRIGNTGYSAGYHLHWALSINNVAVDPVEWTTNKFS